MKQKISIILILIITLGVGLFSGYCLHEYLQKEKDSEKIEEPKQDNEKEETIYEKLLKGDFSGIAGDYVLESGDKPIRIFQNGNVDTGYFVAERVSEPRRDDNGSYKWDYVTLDTPTGGFVTIYPEGVKVFDGSEYVEADTSKIRMALGNGYPTRESIRYKKTNETEKITSLDYQDFVGEYINKEGHIAELISNGVLTTEEMITLRISDFQKNADGSYSWVNISYGKNHEASYNGKVITVYPKGVKVFNGKEYLEDDTTKVRITITNGYPTQNDIYYKR